MADRVLCPVCLGDYAQAKDGTPYKHNNEQGEVCSGGDQQATLTVADAVWLVYGDEGRFVVTGPVNRNDDHPQDFTLDSIRGPGGALPLLGVVASSSAEDINAVLPEGLRVPTGEPTPDEEPAAVEQGDTDVPAADEVEE